MVQGIDHVVLVVRDLERSLAFYRDVLGCRVLREAEWRRGQARFPSVAVGGGQMLNLHQAGSPVSPEAVNPRVGSEDLCFVASVPIAQVTARLSTHGVPVEIGPVQRMGGRGVMGRSVYFRDPDGNLLEIMSYAEAAAPG